MQSQTKTGPKPQKNGLKKKCKVTFLQGCFFSPAWRSHHCLCHLFPPVRNNEWILSSPFSGPSDLEKLWVALSESGRQFSAPCLHHLLNCVSCSCLWVYAFWPGRFNLSAQESLCCIMPAGPGPGQIHGGSRRFSRGKPLWAAFWEESQAQMYIYGPKLRIKGNSKCCKSGICRVSILHLMLYMAKGLTAWKLVFLFPLAKLLPTIRKTSFPTALDHMAVLVLLGLRTSRYGIQHCRQLWEESFPQEKRDFSTQPQSCEQDGLAMPQIIDSEWAKLLGKLRKLLSLYTRGAWHQ